MGNSLIGLKETKEAMEFLNLIYKHGDIICKYTKVDNNTIAKLLYVTGMH